MQQLNYNAALTLLLLSFNMTGIHAAPEISECLSCHIDFEHRSNQIIHLQKTCENCHAEFVIRTEKHIKPLPLIVDLKSHLGVKVAGRADFHPEKITQGMSLPLYYQTSRLGDSPNPMALIPEGTFIMGTDNRQPDEGPAHKVTLRAYYIDIYEVTNLQYKHFIDETHRRSPKHFSNRTYPEGKTDHPVTQVSWKDANAYCRWAGKRLPTDQEWEKAARGKDQRFFPWGNEFNPINANTPQRWGNLGLEGDTTPVGSFNAGVSPYGIFDMSGNVWEWTSSWYQAYPGDTHITENYGQKYKTLKGGSWWDCSFYKCGISAPVYNRSFFLRSTKNSSFGFRCAHDA